MCDLVSSLIQKIVSGNKLQKGFLQSSVELLSDEDMKDFNAYIKYCLERGRDIAYLASSYDLVVKDMLQQQVYFRRHNHYRYSRVDEVASSVYFNDDYMNKYMTGLALSTFLWPNHLAIKKFFVKTLPKDKSGIYLEIGPGHGFNLMMAMRSTSYSHFVGVDISPSSVEMTKSILGCEYFGCYSNYEIVGGDFLKWPVTTKFNAVVMGEVLEHVENPLDFLKKINEIADDNAYIFITTCINSPAVDHIYLYRSRKEIEEQVNSAGLHIKESLFVPYTGTTMAESEEQALSINVALLLGK